MDIRCTGGHPNLDCEPVVFILETSYLPTVLCCLQIITRKFPSLSSSWILAVSAQNFSIRFKFFIVLKPFPLFLKKSNLLQEMLPETEMLLSQVNIYWHVYNCHIVSLFWRFKNTNKNTNIKLPKHRLSLVSLFYFYCNELYLDLLIRRRKKWFSWPFSIVPNIHAVRSSDKVHNGNGNCG